MILFHLKNAIEAIVADKETLKDNLTIVQACLSQLEEEREIEQEVDKNLRDKIAKLENEVKTLKALLEIKNNPEQALKPKERIEYETSCKKCGGFIGEPGKVYGYAGKWCVCAWIARQNE